MIENQIAAIWKLVSLIAFDCLFLVVVAFICSILCSWTLFEISCFVLFILTIVYGVDKNGNLF